MKAHYAAWVLVPFLIGVAMYGAGSSHWGRMFMNRSVSVLEYPQLIELGERELGDVAIGKLTMANRGGKELVIDQVQSTCSCLGLEREVDGKEVRVDSLKIAPGEQVALSVRVSVRGTPGNPAESVIAFRSNDPQRPQGAIQVTVSRVKAGAATIPTSVDFGTLLLADEGKQFLDVYDSSVKSRALARVASASPDVVSVRIMEDAAAPEAPAEKLGTWIGRLEVTANANSPGPLNSEIEIHLAGERRPPTVVPVWGQIAGPIAVSPSALVLPRVSNSGPLYSSECVCRSTSGEPLRLELESVPEGLSAEVQSVEGEASQRVRIEWNEKRAAMTKQGDETQASWPCHVRLRATVGIDETVIEIPIYCKRSSNS